MATTCAGLMGAFDPPQYFLSTVPQEKIKISHTSSPDTHLKLNLHKLWAFAIRLSGLRRARVCVRACVCMWPRWCVCVPVVNYWPRNDIFIGRLKYDEASGWFVADAIVPERTEKSRTISSRYKLYIIVHCILIIFI